jgi:hypothetical protein
VVVVAMVATRRKETIMAQALHVKAVKKPPKADNELLNYSKAVVTKGTGNAALANPGTIFPISTLRTSPSRRVSTT